MSFRKQVLSIIFLQFVILFSISNLIAQDDQILLNAQKRHLEAGELFKKNTAEARQAAKGLYLENVSIFEAANDAKRLGETLYRLSDLSDDYQIKVDYLKKAAPLFQQIGNLKAFALMLNNICTYQEQIGDTQSVLPFCQKSVETYREINDKYGESVALSNQGNAYRATGQFREAFESFELSLKLRRDLKDASGEIITLVNLGRLYDRIGETRKGIDYAKSALSIAERMNDAERKSLALNLLASLSNKIGNYQMGLDYHQQALSIAKERSDKRLEGASLNNLAVIYSTLGEKQRAIEYYQNALLRFQELGIKQAEASVLASLGGSYQAVENLEKALEFQYKSLEVSRQLGDKSGQSKTMINLATINAENGMIDAAIKLGLEGLLLAEESNSRDAISKATRGLGYFYYVAKNENKSAEFLEKAIKLCRESEDSANLALSLYRYARLDSYFGHKESAVAKMKEVIEIIENSRNSFASQDLRSSFLSTKKQFYDFYIELLVDLHKDKPGKGYDELALQMSESARARSLLDSLGDLQKEIRGSAPPELLQEISILRQRINFKDSQRLRALQKNEAAGVKGINEELTNLLRQLDELQTKVRRYNPQFASLNNPQPLNLKEIQKEVLDTETVLLEYSIGDRRSFLFFATSNKLEIFELPGKDSIEKNVRQALEHLKSRGQIIQSETAVQRDKRIKDGDLEFQKNIDEISRVLLLPVVEKIQNKRLLVVGSGVLQYLPFSVLKNKTRYLIETNEVINLPSASTLPLLRKSKSSETGKRNEVAILADPIFSITDSRLSEAAKQNSGSDVLKAPAKTQSDDKSIPSALRSDFSRLRFSRIEAESISSLAKTDQKHVALDFAANLDSVNSEAVRRSNIVHFATHGVVNSQLPELSSIVLSLIDENGKNRDGFLRLSDIYNMKLSANLVVMSACETALGKDINGEGIVGLTRGFMFAGAQSIVASLWKVDDRATADLMAEFYRKMLKDGMSPASSLRASQIAMIRSKSLSNPYYWAAFTIQGDFKKPVVQK